MWLCPPAARYCVLLAMEDSEGEAGQQKARALEDQFRERFCWIGHSTHALQPRELAGKGANLNSA